MLFVEQLERDRVQRQGIRIRADFVRAHVLAFGPGADQPQGHVRLQRADQQLAGRCRPRTGQHVKSLQVDGRSADLIPAQKFQLGFLPRIIPIVTKTLAETTLARDQAAEQLTARNIAARIVSQIEHQLVDPVAREFREDRFQRFVVGVVAGRRALRPGIEGSVGQIADPVRAAHDDRIGQNRVVGDRLGCIYDDLFFPCDIVNEARYGVGYALHEHAGLPAAGQRARSADGNIAPVHLPDPVSPADARPVCRRALDHVHDAGCAVALVVGIDVQLELDAVGVAAETGRFRRIAALHRRVEIVAPLGMFAVVVVGRRREQAEEETFAALFVRLGRDPKPGDVVVVEVLILHLGMDPAVGCRIGMLARRGQRILGRSFGAAGDPYRPDRDPQRLTNVHGKRFG